MPLLLSASLLVLFPSRAAAQIVNVQPLISANDQHKEGPALAIEGAADMRRGNTSLLSVSGSVIGYYRSGRHVGFLMGRAEYGESQGDTNVSKNLEHARYRFTVAGPFSVEAFLQHDRDSFRRLALRALSGAGARLRVVWWDGFEASLGAAYMLEYEVLSRGDERDSGTSALNHRLSSYMVLSTRLAKRLDFGLTAYAQPRLDQWSDVRLLSESSLIARATQYLSMKLTLTSAFDSKPPADVAPLDTTLKGSLQATF